MTPPPQLENVHRDEASWTDDPEERVRLRGDRKRCVDYLMSQPWCAAVKHAYLAYGVGGVISLFLVEIEPTADVDRWLWCVVGDLPTAYFVLDDTNDAADALGVYADLMDDWAHAMLEHRPTDDVFPVAAAATESNARALLRRTAFVRDEIIADLRT